MNEAEYSVRHGRIMSAGGFSDWLLRFLQAQNTNSAVEVPCGDCTLCCTSSYFVHIGPDETETFARIPKGMLFPAPGLPKGRTVLGYDEKGHCPMFAEGGCSIYNHRPKTCRMYDCRIFPATGLYPEKDKDLLAQHAQKWEFVVQSEDDRHRFKAVRAAVSFIRDYADFFPAGNIPNNSPRQAVLAVKIHEEFLNADRHPPYKDKRHIRKIIRNITEILGRTE